MHDLLENKSVWWKEPMVWLLIALPLSAVVGGVVTIWLAARKADSLVSEDYYKEGLAIHQVIERDARATALALAAHLSAEPSRLTLRLEGRVAPPAKLHLAIIHATQSSQDRTLDLRLGDDGSYHAALPSLEAGEKRLVLEPDDRSWRLAGRWRSPFDGSLTLESTPAQATPKP